MQEFYFQCVKKDKMEIGISPDEAFNKRIYDKLLSMTENELSFKDEAPIFESTPFVEVDVHQNEDSYYVIVIPDHQISKFEKFIPTLKGLFFDYDKECELITIFGPSYHINQTYDLYDVLNEEINSLMIAREDFEAFKAFMRSINSVKKLDYDISFKSKISGKMRTYTLDSSYYKNFHCYGYLADIEKYVKEIDRLRDLSNKDSLTGLFNKQYTTTFTKQMIELAEPNDIFLLGIIDIDYFKNVNDTYGHMFGDKLLIQFSNSLKRSIGESGLVGRIGGDEFLFLLKVDRTEEAYLKPICRRIRDDVHNIRIDGVKGFMITSTIGLACYPKDATTYNDLFECADKALYRGKLKGRDCYIIYDEAKHKNISKQETSNFFGAPERRRSDTTFISDCLDSLLETSNLAKEIDTIVSKIANHFRIDRITISDHNLKVLFQYSQDGNYLHKGYDLLLDPKYQALFVDNMLQITDIVQLRMNNPEIMDYYSKQRIKSLVQIIFKRNDQITGFISFDMYLERRSWQPSELMYFSILSKIISGFFNKYQTEQKLEQITYMDEITGISNFAKFRNDILQDHYAYEKGVFVLFDVANFKQIDEKYGYKTGNDVLVVIAQVLTELSYGKDYFCRVHDDVFAVYREYVSQEETINYFNKLNSEVISNLKNMNIIFDFKLVGGAALFVNSDNTDFTTLIDNANDSRKYAKNENVKLVFYSQDVNKQAMHIKLIEGRMDAALLNNEFEVYLQPCYDIKTKSIESFEALIRWNFDKEILTPDRFIPIFEKNGFIERMDFYVFEQVIKILSQWEKKGYKMSPISVNISRCHLSDSDFLTKLDNLFKKYNANKNYFAIEVTEALFEGDNSYMIRFLNEAAVSGYQIFLDNFGVAYSALSILSKLPVNALKLNRSFMENDLYGDKELLIVKNIIKLAKELGIGVVSEGIETKSQSIEMRKLHCDYAQGYYYSKPMPISVIEKEFVKKRK